MIMNKIDKSIAKVLIITIMYLIGIIGLSPLVIFIAVNVPKNIIRKPAVNVERRIFFRILKIFSPKIYG